MLLTAHDFVTPFFSSFFLGCWALLLLVTMNISLFANTCVFGMELFAALFTMTAPSNIPKEYTILKNFQQIYGGAFFNSFFSSESRCVTM
jgi:hypothetical protein